jgi:AbrB family looped-hinge helix DNA binding protein
VCAAETAGRSATARRDLDRCAALRAQEHAKLVAECCGHGAKRLATTVSRRHAGSYDALLDCDSGESEWSTAPSSWAVRERGPSITRCGNTAFMRVTTKGQVTIPQEIRDALGLLPSTEVTFEIVDAAASYRVVTA